MTNSTAPRSKRWLKTRPRPAPSPGLILDHPPHVQLNIYGNQVYLVRRVALGWQTYPIDASEVVTAFGKLPVSTGLLPPNTVMTGMLHGAPYFAVFIPPALTKVRIAISNGVKVYSLQTPPMLWCGRGTDYRVYALQRYPERLSDQLMRAPFPNTYESGRVCWGSVEKLPDAKDGGIMKAWKTFVAGSNFSLHVADQKSRKYPANVVTMWEHLGQDQPYPVDDLVATSLRISDVASGKIWGLDAR